MGKIKAIVGDNIRRLRRDRGWTQAFVAESLGITAPFLTMVESGQRGMSLELIESLGELFGVPVSSFFISRESDNASISRQELFALKKRLTLKMTKLIEDAIAELGV